MGITIEKIDAHWGYLLAIEQDLARLSRFVEFDERNFGAFSIETSHLLLTASAEADVVCKLLCKSLNPKSKADSIGKYKSELLSAFPRLPRFVVTIPRHGLVLKPWSNWNPKRKADSNPDWWTAYNKIKHHRDSEFIRGNLKNAINAVAGLFVVTLYLYRNKAEAGSLLPNPDLLRVTDSNFNGFTAQGVEMGINYVL